MRPTLRARGQTAGRRSTDRLRLGDAPREEQRGVASCSSTGSPPAGLVCRIATPGSSSRATCSGDPDRRARRSTRASPHARNACTRARRLRRGRRRRVLRGSFVLLVPAPSSRAARPSRSSSGACCSRAGVGAPGRALRRLRRRVGCSRAGSGGSSARPTASRPGASTSRSSTRAPTSSASWRARSTACACASRSSTTRAASSSPTRRTSCARRSSRSAASSSCSTTRSSTRPHAARVPGDDARAGRPADAARHRPARPVAARRRPHDRSSARAGRSRRAGAHDLAEEFGPLALVERARSRWRRRRRRCFAERGRASACSRSGGPWSRTRSLHTPPGTPVRVRDSRAGRTRCSRSRTRAPGIPEDQRAAGLRALLPRSTARAPPAAGSGLAIARELAELMGGRARARVAAGQDGVHAGAPAAGAASARRPGAVFTGKRPSPHGAQLQCDGCAQPSPLAARLRSARRPRRARARRADRLDSTRARRRPSSASRRQRAVRRRPPPRPSVRDAKPLAGNGFDPERDLRKPLARSRHDLLRLRHRPGDRARRPRARLRRLPGGLHPHERARDHRRAATDTVGRARRQGLRRVPDGDRVDGRIVGWDVFDDVGVVKVDPGSHALRAGPARRTPPPSSSASRWRRSAARSGTRTRSRSASSRRRGARSRLADLGLRPDRRDPDRRADQPRQLRRAAASTRAAA